MANWIPRTSAATPWESWNGAATIRTDPPPSTLPASTGAVMSMQYMNLQMQFNNAVYIVNALWKEGAELKQERSELAALHAKAITAQNAENVKLRAELHAIKDRITSNQSLQHDRHILDQTELMRTKLELDAARGELSDIASERLTIQDERKVEMRVRAAQKQYELDCSYCELGVLNSQDASIKHDGERIAAQAEMLSEYDLKLSKMELGAILTGPD